jgi:hypothetical protein
MEEGSDSDDEGAAGSEHIPGNGQGGSPTSLPAKRMLGDFLGADWCVVAAARRRRAGKHSAFAPGGRGSSFTARVARSVEMKASGALEVNEFPPLPAPVVAAPRSPAPSCAVRVGSVVVLLEILPAAGGCPEAAAPSMGTEMREIPERGDVAVYRPLVAVKVVGPAL